MAGQTLKTMFMGLTESQKLEVREYYERHFAEGGSPDFLPILADFSQQLEETASQVATGARLQIKSFSEYGNEAQLLAVYQNRAAEDPEAAKIKEPTYFITEEGERLIGPLLPSLAEEIIRLQNEMANDEWDKSFYPDFSYLPGGTPPKPADYNDIEKFKQAEDAYFYGYAIDFMPTDRLVHLPLEITDEDQQHLSPALIIADFLYENYFFGGENVTAIKQALIADVQKNEATGEHLLKKYENDQQLDDKLAAFLAADSNERSEDITEP